MSYTIKKTDGTTLATVPENEIILDKASVALVGRGSTNYGVSHSENFVKLLENFANSTPPPHALQGQMWYDKTVGSLKVYSGTTWNQIGGGAGGTGADGSGIVYVGLATGSALALVAGGKVVAVLSSRNVPTIDLPETIQFLDAALPFRARFPDGLEAGQTLATDPDDYIYEGHVPVADQALYTGGGTPLAATSYLDLGDASITLTVASGMIIFASSSEAVANSALPANVTVGSETIPLSAVFPNGLAAGLTFATGFGLSINGGSITGGGSIGGGEGGGSSLTIQVMEDYVDTSIASARTTWFAEADALYATAGIETEIVSAFTSTTGQQTLAEAVDWILTVASEGTGSAEAGTLIRSEITDAITGATSFANALSRLNTSVTKSTANSSAIDTIQAELVSGTGATSMANVSDKLSATATAASAGATLSTSIDAALKTATGQTTTAAAINTMWATANAGGGSVAGWGVKVEAGGLVAGIELLADTSQNVSAFKVLANNFKIVHPNTPEVTPFEVKDNITYIKTLMIGNGTLGYEKLTPLNFTSQVYKGSTVAASSTHSALYSGTLTSSTGTSPKGSKVCLFLSMNISGSDNAYMYVNIVRKKADGTGTKTLQGRAEFGVPDSGGSAQTWIWTDTLPDDGSYVYTVWGARYNGDVNIRASHLIGLIQRQYDANAVDTASSGTTASGSSYGGGGGQAGTGSGTNVVIY